MLKNFGPESTKLSIKGKTQAALQSLSKYGNVNTITDPKGIENAFKSHYTTLAEKILKNENIEMIVIPRLS